MSMDQIGYNNLSDFGSGVEENGNENGNGNESVEEFWSIYSVPFLIKITIFFASKMSGKNIEKSVKKT